jgi:uncharacterized protein (DUF427 family)
MKAVWQGKVLAHSDKTILIEGNHYFPPDSIKRECFAPSETHSTCSWKGVANYYHVRVGDKSNSDAAWYYPRPSEAAKSIKDYVAFWRGVEVTE